MKRTLLFVALILTLTACSGPTAEPAEPLTIIEEAANHIQEAESFAVTIERTGAPVYIDGNGIINFLRATGYYVAPDRVQARVRVAVSGLAGDIDVIAIGNDQYYRHTVLTGGQWLAAEFSPGFNAETLVRSESGLSRAMQAINDLAYTGTENLNGIRMHHLTGTAAGSEVAALTIGLIPAEADVLVDLYVRTDNGQAERMVIVQPDTVSEDYPEPSTWIVEVYDYDGEYTVEAPVAAQAPSLGIEQTAPEQAAQG